MFLQIFFWTVFTALASILANNDLFGRMNNKVVGFSYG